MDLNQIYQPIERELKDLEKGLEVSLKESKNESILKLNRFLLESPGKRIRPALLILCAKATLNKVQSSKFKGLINIAAAIELIHIASLIHDDVVDHSDLRHHKPSVNSKWGEDVSIALGDYLYSLAFKLISACGNTDILDCISSATKSMCEGELIQVIERDNLSLLKERYLLIVKKKTASLFAASCQAGAIVSGCPGSIQNALKQYGLNFGIAFQIVDDYLDLIGETKDLGKPPGADFRMGELTLPVLNLLTQTKDRYGILSLIKEQTKPAAFKELRQRFINSRAQIKTKDDIAYYIRKAKESLDNLKNLGSKQSLFNLADYLVNKIF